MIALAVFGAWLSTLPLLLASLTILAPTRRRRALVRATGAVVVLTLVLLLPVREYRWRVDALDRKVVARGPDALSTRDLASVWLLNVVMAAGGWACGLPEVATETLLLAVPGQTRREFESDFAMRSPRVREALRGIFRQARTTGPGRFQANVDWSSYDTGDAPRVALALNPVTLSADAQSDASGRWSLDVRAVVPVSYPPRAKLRLPMGIVVHEGLFWALQERGWLFPYDAEYRWTVEADDPRFSATQPITGIRESLVFAR